MGQVDRFRQDVRLFFFFLERARDATPPFHSRGAPDVPEPLTLGTGYLTR